MLPSFQKLAFLLGLASVAHCQNLATSKHASKHRPSYPLNIISCNRTLSFRYSCLRTSCPLPLKSARLHWDSFSVFRTSLEAPLLQPTHPLTRLAAWIRGTRCLWSSRNIEHPRLYREDQPYHHSRNIRPSLDQPDGLVQ